MISIGPDDWNLASRFANMGRPLPQEPFRRRRAMPDREQTSRYTEYARPADARAVEAVGCDESYESHHSPDSSAMLPHEGEIDETGIGSSGGDAVHFLVAGGSERKAAGHGPGHFSFPRRHAVALPADYRVAIG